MNVIIVGAGITGSLLAKTLIARGNNVVLIEQNEETARHAANRLDCMVINNKGNSIRVLNDAGIKKADLLIMVTDSDELNLITCGIAENLAPDVFKIARVRNENYLETFKMSSGKLLGVDKMVFPDEVAAKSIINAIEHGAISDILTFKNSEYEIARFMVNKNSILNGLAVLQISEHIHCPFVVVSVEENGHTIIPSGKTVLKQNAKISVLALPEHIKQFYALAGLTVKKLRKIAIVGMGRIGTIIADYFFAEQKIGFFKSIFKPQAKKNIIMIEKDEATAKEAAKKFPDALVYNSDIMNEGFIEEAALAECDLVIAVTKNYELNMIASTLLKNLGVDKTITLLQGPAMETIANNIGIDVVISYKGAVADAILSHISGENVKAVHTIGDGTLEILEINVAENANVVGKPLSEISEHGTFLVLMIERGSQSILPTGSTQLEAGDHVVLICQASETERLSKMIYGEK